MPERGQGLEKRLAQRKFLSTEHFSECSSETGYLSRMSEYHPRSDLFPPRRSGRDLKGLVPGCYACLAIGKGIITPALTG